MNKLNNPFSLLELAILVCSFADDTDLINVALVNKLMAMPALQRRWHLLRPRKPSELMLLRRTLQSSKTFLPYQNYVRAFIWRYNDNNIWPDDFFDVFVFPQLTRLELSCFITDERVARMLSKSCKHLCNVNLSNCLHMTEQAILPLVKQLQPNCLETLSFHGNKQSDLTSMAKLIELQQNSLVSIRLSETTDCVLDAISTCSSLRDLNLEHSSEEQLSEGCLQRFFASPTCQQLRQLHMRDIDNFTHQAYVMKSGPPTLALFSVTECHNFNEEGLLAVVARHGMSLKSIKLIGQSGVTDRVLQSIFQHCDHLVYLDISNCCALTNDLFDSAQWPKSLKTLVLLKLQNSISKQAVQNLLSLPNITTIRLDIEFNRSFVYEVLANAKSFYFKEEGTMLVRNEAAP